jgi:hypothetical protein
VTQSGVVGDNFVSVIIYVIHGLEEDPTQKEHRAEASQTEERPPLVAQENVTTNVAQQDVPKQSATYFRKAKKQKQVCACVVIIISAIHFPSQ